MTTEEIIEKTKLATRRCVYLIKEKGEDDILLKCYYFNQFLTELMEINEELILMQQQEVLEII